MENEVLLGFELVCCDAYFECSVDSSLTLREIVEGLQEMSPPEIREEFDLCQPLIFCDPQEHRILDEQKTAAQLRLPDGFKILIF